MRENIRHALLVCPNNDPESHMILKIAMAFGFHVLISNQGQGASLDNEPSLVDFIKTYRRGSDVWIVELPGPKAEQELRDAYHRVTIIDHHNYGKLGLDRSRDEHGEFLPSSLHQFLKLANITDADLRNMLDQDTFDPVIVHGVGYMDARYVQGLREHGYTKGEIARVLHWRREFMLANVEGYHETNRLARRAWEERTELENGILMIETPEHVDIRGAVSEISILDGLDTAQMLIGSHDWYLMFLQHVEPELVDYLMRCYSRLSFTYGSGRCWGLDNRKAKHVIPPSVIVKQINAFRSDPASF